MLFSQDLNPQGLKPLWAMTNDDISTSSTEDRKSETSSDKTPELQIQLSASSSSEELSKQVECLKSWENLQTEVQDVHQLFEDLSLIVKVSKV